MSLDELKRELMKNPAYRKILETPDLAWDCAKLCREARIKRGITQAQLAKKVKTKQSSIARFECGNTIPSLTFLSRIAEATGHRVVVLFGEIKKYDK